MFSLKILISIILLKYSIIYGLTDEERQKFLDMHNHIRRSVVPYASNMQELVYSKEIEKKTQDWVDKCIYEHRVLDDYGENGRQASDDDIIDSVMSWFQERVWFDINAEEKCKKEYAEPEFQNFMNPVQCGHYQIISKATLKSMGCATKYCEKIKSKFGNAENQYLSFCFYDTGSMATPYVTGKPCDSCGLDATRCYNNLCVQNDITNKLATKNITCKNCVDSFGSLCDCDSGDLTNVCLNSKIKEPCSGCRRDGKKCVNGEDSKDTNKCVCKCKDGYEGELCDILTDDKKAAAKIQFKGADWRYGMMVPVNLVKFEKTFPELQSMFKSYIKDLCANKKDKYVKNCNELEKSSDDELNSIKALMQLEKSGVLTTYLFYKFTFTENGNSKTNYIDKTIIADYFTNYKGDPILKKYKDSLKDFRIDYSSNVTSTNITSTTKTSNEKRISIELIIAILVLYIVTF